MIDILTIPKPLREHDQWVCWKASDRGEGKTTKVPYNPRSGEMASCNNPAHWSSLERCMAAKGYTGIGFVFTTDDPFIGIDLDDCIDGAGQLSDEAKAIIDDMGSYAEVSPSGNGVKIIGYGCKPGDRCKTTKVTGMSAVEVYDSGRYFTVTGQKLHIAPSGIGDSQPGIDKNYPVWFPPQAESLKLAPVTIDMADGEILAIARAGANAAKFNRLWAGDSSDNDNDTSAADLALCCCLAFWTGNDSIRIDRMFRLSDRMREKWDAMRGERTYGDITVSRAVELTSEHYTPGTHEDYSWFTETNSSDELSPADELAGLIEKTIAGKRRAIAWKWPVVGSLTKAMVPGTLTILCGNPGATKSFMLIEQVAWWCLQGVKTKCLMLEDTRAYHLQRAIAQHVGNSKITDPDWIEANAIDARRAMERSRIFADRVGACIESPPLETHPTGAMLATWIEYQAKDGARIICVDPITLATPGDKQWVDDHTLIASAKKTAEQYECSVMLVTHPKKHPTGKTLDDVSGGAAVTRFAHTVLWLEFLAEPEQKLLVNRGVFGTQDREFKDVNRILRVLKARNGKGTGAEIGGWFSGDTLTFEALGIITKETA